MLPPAQPALIYWPYGESREFPVLGQGGRTACAGPVFHFREEFRKTGGVVLWRGKPNPELGIPAAHWAGASGEGAYIYCSPDTQFNPTGR